MSAPVPARKTNEIIERLSALPPDAEPRDFAVRQIQREIDKLKKVDVAAAWMLQGMLCATLNDLEGSRDAHRRSVALGPGRSQLLWNESASLCSFSLLAEAREKVGKMLEAGYIETKYIESALWLCMVTLDVERFFHFLGDYADFVQEPDARDVIEEMKQNADVIGAFLSDFPSVRQDVGRLYAHVQSALEEYRQSVVTFVAKEDNFYGQRVLHIDYFVESQAEVVMGMNDALLDKISEDDDFQHWDSIIASFVHVSEEKSQQGEVEYANHP